MKKEPIDFIVFAMREMRETSIFGDIATRSVESRGFPGEK